jgi:hypothetical protein
VEALSAPIEKLSKALQAGLNCGRGKELIVLAHWKSQSYFQEVYTDLYDFCLCLKESCSDADNTIQKDMMLACEAVIEVLTPNERKPVGPIVHADFFGPDCQYSYGLSIYFPWTRPVEDATEHVMNNYRSYAFVTELCGASWLEFLDAYFEKTLRPQREIKPTSRLSFDRKAALKFARARFRPFASRTGQPQSTISALTRTKTSPADASGDFSYTVIKNYSRDFAISDRALKVFANEKKKRKR